MAGSASPAPPHLPAQAARSRLLPADLARPSAGDARPNCPYRPWRHSSSHWNALAFSRKRRRWPGLLNRRRSRPCREVVRAARRVRSQRGPSYHRPNSRRPAAAEAKNPSSPFAALLDAPPHRSPGPGAAPAGRRGVESNSCPHDRTRPNNDDGESTAPTGRQQTRAPTGRPARRPRPRPMMQKSQLSEPIQQHLPN